MSCEKGGNKMGGMGSMSNNNATVPFNKKNSAGKSLTALFTELHDYVYVGINEGNNGNSCYYSNLNEANLQDLLRNTNERSTKRNRPHLRNILMDIKYHPFFEDNVEPNKDLLNAIDDFINMLDSSSINPRAVIQLITTRLCNIVVNTSTLGGGKRTRKRSTHRTRKRSTHHTRNRTRSRK